VCAAISGPFEWLISRAASPSVTKTAPATKVKSEKQKLPSRRRSWAFRVSLGYSLAKDFGVPGSAGRT
jgi:hypothetical protein